MNAILLALALAQSTGTVSVSVGVLRRAVLVVDVDGAVRVAARRPAEAAGSPLGSADAAALARARVARRAEPSSGLDGGEVGVVEVSF
jgi:hypothetical protein